MEKVDAQNVDLMTIFNVRVQLDVVESLGGRFGVLDWNGDVLEMNADRFRAIVTPQDVFSSANKWRNESVVKETTGWTQTATDGDHYIEVKGSNWKYFVWPSDVNNSGTVTPVDTLRIINEIENRNFSNEDDWTLSSPDVVGQWPGLFYEQNGDGGRSTRRSKGDQ